MDPNQLKQIVSKHFDFAPSGTGQYLHGDWFSAKHKDSLDDLLSEIVGLNDEDLKSDLAEAESDLEAEKSKNETLEARIEELEKELEAA